MLISMKRRLEDYLRMISLQDCLQLFAGSNYYLTKSTKAKEDIDKLWPGKDVDDMTIIALEGGQVGVVGGFVHLLKEPNEEGEGKEKRSDGSCMEGVIAFSVKHKAVHQPIFRHRRWLENEKAVIPEGEEESVADIETRLSPLRGQSASAINYVDEAIVERLLNVVGGSLGRRIEDNEDMDPILIGVGLNQFPSKSKLSSLHSIFLSYYIRTWAPWAMWWSRYYYRDVMVAQDICEIVLYRLKNFEGPRHQQPLAADGAYPWMASPSTSSSNPAEGSTTAASSSSSPSRA
ncbi:MAG: hypothetical protein J3R72DRAFT_491720 [Linnemannia gamsii]|nr:MAG: hypothetical protein J3R72DRAFT_491720 [Linnemannia gamsii]